MKFGLKLHHSGPGASPEYMKRWAQFAETIGLHLIMVADHVALTPEVLGRYPAPYYETFTNLAWLAAHTKKVMLGTTVVVVPYRNPVMLAKAASSLDRLARGRLILGCGAGYLREEFDALGVDFDERNALFDESLEVLRAAWSGESVKDRRSQGPWPSTKCSRL